VISLAGQPERQPEPEKTDGDMVKSFQEEADIVLDSEESSALPRREDDEVGSGRRDESSRLQEQTSAAESRDLCLA